MFRIVFVCGKLKYLAIEERAARRADTVCFAGFEIMCDFDGSPRDCGVVMNMNKCLRL